MNTKKYFIKKILFCGSGPLTDEINIFAKTKLPNFEIIIIENLDKKNYLNLVKNSSGFLFPSYREAFPLSLLELFLFVKIFYLGKYIYDFNRGSYGKRT